MANIVGPAHLVKQHLQQGPDQQRQDGVAYDEGRQAGGLGAEGAKAAAAAAPAKGSEKASSAGAFKMGSYLRTWNSTQHQEEPKGEQQQRQQQQEQQQQQQAGQKQQLRGQEQQQQQAGPGQTPAAAPAKGTGKARELISSQGRGESASCQLPGSGQELHKATTQHQEKEEDATVGPKDQGLTAVPGEAANDDGAGAVAAAPSAAAPSATPAAAAKPDVKGFLTKLQQELTPEQYEVVRGLLAGYR
jgi:hypothetical protein